MPRCFSVCIFHTWIELHWLETFWMNYGIFFFIKYLCVQINDGVGKKEKWLQINMRALVGSGFFFLLFIIFIFFGDKLCFSFLSHEFIYLHIIKSQNISILLLKEKIQLNQAQYLPHHCENFYFFYKCGPGNSWSIF